uniref:Uncharacterized protein n=1 Tax=Octopus bimaculoides TaxID=37653 RepID=A0A0L8FQU1_OCTBM
MSDLSDSDSQDDETYRIISNNEKLLQASRNGDIDAVKLLIAELNDGKIELDLNCKGMRRSNRGWSPLHLSAYFGHTAVVKLLLEAGANFDIQNDMGDTPLHRAAYTSREDVVMLLLSHGANISTVNTEGHTPKSLASAQVKHLLEASEKSDSRRLVNEFMSSSLHGQIDDIKGILNQNNAPDINSVDKFGNTALHLAALRNHKQVAILLLQYGIDTSLKNNNGQRAVDLTTSPNMKHLLNVRPVQDIPVQSVRQEGPILKKTRFFGFKSLWMVLEKGIVSYFSNRGDASTGARRKGMKYLDHATIELDALPNANHSESVVGAFYMPLAQGPEGAGSDHDWIVLFTRCWHKGQSGSSGISHIQMMLIACYQHGKPLYHHHHHHHHHHRHHLTSVVHAGMGWPV